MCCKRVLLIAILFCGFGASDLHAQGYLTSPEWLEVGSLGANYHFVYPLTYTAIFFFDPIHGVIATSKPEIYYIVNPSEGEWLAATIPSGFSTVRQIRFIEGKLYAATDGPDILVSNDSGKTWAYAGLGFSNANDIYADASGNIRVLTNPMTRFARIDTLDCIATGGGSIFRSSDGGLNWISVVTGIDPLSIGAFGDPCKHVFIAPSTWGTAALRSTDSGQTWHDVLTGASAFPEYIDGASTTCYLNDTGGMFRSIDDGVTWTSITSVNSGPHFPMFVWGPMGEHVAMSYWFIVIINGVPVTLIEPWTTTTGGDGNLHSAVAITDSNGAPLGQEDTMNVPFRVVSKCNSFSIPIALEADIPGLFIEASLTNTGGGDVTLLGSDSIYFSQPILNERYVQDTMWLAYDPHHLVDTATLTFQNQWNCSDWSETRTVIITSIPSATIAPPPVFAGSCQPVREAAYVELDSCSTLIIDSVQIPSAISSRLTLTKPLPDTLHIGTNDSLFFTFNPADTIGALSGNVQLFAHFYPAPGLDSTLNYFNFNLYLDGDSDFAFFEQSIPVNLIAQPSLPWKLYPSPPVSAVPGTDVTFKILQSQTLPSDVAALDFNLTYDNDLLRFVRAEEPSVDTTGYVRTSDGLAHVTFHVTPVPSDSVIATLHFIPYVARSSQTTVLLDNPNLLTSAGDPEHCVDSITTGETMFTVSPVCGSGELSSYLQTGTILIDNINPNPASESIVVAVSGIVGDASGATSPTSATLSIIDALGRTVSQQYVVLAPGDGNQFQINIENLPGGIYAVQLRGAGVVSTREFVKE
jgi:photosystem II stability/assembly factor-like uncharacterized protein